MKPYRIAASMSTTGIVLIFTLIIISIPSFTGAQGCDYSFAQCFISELGNPYKNNHHYLLNYGFIAIGILFMPMIVVLSKHTETKTGRVAGIIAFLAMLALSCVGIIPEHNPLNHKIAAFSFFTLVSVALGIYAVMSIRNKNLDNWLLIPKLIPILLFMIFLVFPKTELINISSDPWNYIRPDIVWLAVFEWLFFLTMCIWVLCVSYFLWKRGKQLSSNSEQLPIAST
jgi:hypothetical membrane protein